MAGEWFDRVEQGSGSKIQNIKENQSTVALGFSELPAGAETSSDIIQNRLCVALMKRSV